MKNVGTDHEAFEDHYQTVEAKNEAEPPLIVSTKSHGKDRANESDHTSKGWDDLEQAA